LVKLGWILLALIITPILLVLWIPCYLGFGSCYLVHTELFNDSNCLVHMVLFLINVCIVFPVCFCIGMAINCCVIPLAILAFVFYVIPAYIYNEIASRREIYRRCDERLK